MSDDRSQPATPAGGTRGAGISRRDFNTVLGLGAVGTALHPVAAGAAAAAQPVPSRVPELCEMTAVELADRLRRKQVSAREVMSAHLTRMERVNPRVNAMVTLVAEQAMANAAKADDAMARRATPGVLHGLPVAHKDLLDTAGIRTTRGSLFEVSVRVVSFQAIRLCVCPTRKMSASNPASVLLAAATSPPVVLAPVVPPE